MGFGTSVEIAPPSLNCHLNCVCHRGTDQDLHIQFPHGPVSSRGYNESCYFWEQKKKDLQSQLSTLLNELVSSEASASSLGRVS